MYKKITLVTWNRRYSHIWTPFPAEYELFRSAGFSENNYYSGWLFTSKNVLARSEQAIVINLKRKNFELDTFWSAKSYGRLVVRQQNRSKRTQNAQSNASTLLRDLCLIFQKTTMAKACRQWYRSISCGRLQRIPAQRSFLVQEVRKSDRKILLDCLRAGDSLSFSFSLPSKKKKNRALPCLVQGYLKMDRSISCTECCSIVTISTWQPHCFLKD